MRILLICILLLTLVVSHATAQESPPFVQTALNAIFVVGDESTTAMYSFTYAQPAFPEIRWIIPLPPNALSAHLDTTYLPIYTQGSTEPNLDPAYNGDTEHCELSVQLGIGDGYLPAPSYYLPESSTLHVMNNAEQAQNYLSSAGYLLSDEQRMVLQHYEAENYSFAGLTITPDANIPEAGRYWTSTNLHVSPTIVVEYAGETPTMPIAFHSNFVAAHLDNYDNSGVMPVTAYIFADTPFVPAGSATFQPDLRRIEGARNQLANTMRLINGDPIFFDQLDPEYYSLFLEGIESNNGQALVGEFIGQPQQIDINYDPYPREQINAVEGFNQFAASYPILSRWRTFLRVGLASDDLVFSPDSTIESFRVDFNDAVDGAWFFGCTSRKLYDPALESRLPAGRTYIDRLHLSLAHPESWVLSTLNDEEIPIYVLSPNPVTHEELMARRTRRGGPPMMMIQGRDENGNNGEVYAQYMTGEIFQPWEANACGHHAFYLPSPNAIPWADASATEPLRSIYIAIYTNTEDCADNQYRYQDMYQYAGSYQFFLSDRLRHTLFFGALYNLTAIGYPEGWVESLDHEGERVILPEGAAYETSPAVYVLPYARDLDAVLQARYEVSDIPAGMPVEFEADRRRGYLVLTYNNFAPVIEFSAPANMFDEYAGLLWHMADSVWVNRLISQ